MKQYAWPIGLALTAIVFGAGGFYIGTLNERVANLEARTINSPQASMNIEARSPQVAAAAPVYPQVAPQQSFPTTPVIPSAASSVATSGLDADGVPVQAKAVLDSPDLAARLLEAVSKTTAVTTPGADGATANPVYAFIDPRCPYCHKAAQELLGQVPVTWIPTTLLGDTEGGVKLVEAMQSATDPVQAIQNMQAGTLTPVEASVETREAVNENAGVLYSIYAGAENQIAVPTLLVPEADGSIKLFRGFGDGDGAKVVAAYGG